MSRQRAAWVVAVAAIAAVLALLLPWATSGDRSRSSVALLRSASALDVFATGERWLLTGAWFAVVVAAAGGLVAVAWRRVELGAAVFAGIGPALVVALLILRRSPLGVDWGAYVSSGLGLVSSIGSGALLARRAAEGGRP